MDWLWSSIDPSRAHVISDAVAWHARLMTLAWVVIFPTGILIARFAKITPRQEWPKQLDNQVWWHSHWALQSIGGIGVITALWLVWDSPEPGITAWLHRTMGWTVVSFCAMQFLAGWLRGSKGGPTDLAGDGSMKGDHFDMTYRRLAFEYMHKFLGYFALFLSWTTAGLGLWYVNAPIWMWLVLSLWIVVLFIAFILLQKKGLAIDTYQAIWGPDPELPGNQRKPIGFGVKRH